MPGKRILLVDYDPRSLTHTREVLEGAGFDVSTCGDGISALDQFKNLLPDLVLLSAMLPKMHGFEVCSNIRKLPRGDKTPVVIITDVYKGKRYRLDAITKYGATEYIERPIEDSNLVSILQDLVKGNGAHSAPAKEPAIDVEKTAQFDRHDLMSALKEVSIGAKPKPKASDDIEKKLEQSLAGLELDLGRKAKPKTKPGAPASASAAAPATTVGAGTVTLPAPATAASASVESHLESAGPTIAVKQPPVVEGGETFTAEDLFTDVIASVEREL